MWALQADGKHDAPSRRSAVSSSQELSAQRNPLIFDVTSERTQVCTCVEFDISKAPRERALGLAGLKLWSNGGNVIQSNGADARLLIAVFASTLMLCPEPSQAQIRSPYSPGLNSTNSGTLPDPGFTYINFF